MRVGLTGGIGSGKSAVAQFFGNCGAAVIDTDVLAREVVAPGTAAFAEIAARWPQTITTQGSLDRAALARIVFADAAERSALNAIVHPRVRERTDALEASELPGEIVVVVVPLLFEGDFWTTCARTVVVCAPRAVRVARVIARDGLDRAAVEARMDAQIDPARAAELADFAIVNDGDLASLERRSREVFAALRDEVRV